MKRVIKNWVVISPQKKSAAVVLEVPPGDDGFFSFGGGTTRSLVAPRENVWWCQESDWRNLKSAQNEVQKLPNFDFRF